MTFADLVTDSWAHAHCDDPKLRELDVDENYDATLRELGLDDATLGAGGDSEVIADVTYEDPAQ
jgi:hypothetical protein